MKLHTRWYSLPCATLALMLALATPAAHPAEAPAPPPQNTVRLLSVEVLQHYDRARRQRIQDALAFVFDGDPAYAAAYGTPNKPLSDNVVGPITLSFVNRFWLYYNMEPAGNVTEGSVDALLQFAERLKRRPAWRSDVVSAQFGRWIDLQADRADLYRIRLAVDPVRLPPVLVRYRASLAGPASGIDVENAPLSVYWYGLTAEDLAAIAALPAYPPKLLQALDPLLEAEVFKTAADFSDAVRATLKHTGQDAGPLMPQLEQAAKSESGYALTEDILAELHKQPMLPPQIAKMLGDLVGMQYVRRSLFDLALIQRLRIGLGACRAYLSPEERLRQQSKRLSEEDMRALLSAVDAQAGDAAEARLGSQLQALWEGGHCTVARSEDVPLAALYARYSKLFDSRVRKAPAYDQAQPYRLNSDLCGCNTDNLKQQVYHFLPFWLGGPAQKMDFSLMSRINYYGVTFDNNGDLRMASSGQKATELFMGNQAQQLAFVTEARRHRVKVDWVIHRTDWAPWQKIEVKNRQAILNRLAANIIGLLDTPMTGLRSELLPWLSFGTQDVPGRGDGVTLYFDGYPTDDNSVALFDEFITTLRQRLTAGGFDLNIMIRHAELNKGIYRFDKLAAMVSLPERTSQSALYGWAKNKIKHNFGPSPSSADFVQPHYLMLLEEPTMDNKKTLRSEVEDATHGLPRMALLRRMVPVINFDGLAWPQLEEELIYFNDNFGGVAFWPNSKRNTAEPNKTAVAGVTLCSASQLLDDCIQDHFRDPPGEADSLACKFICENRWPLRFLFNVLVLALAATLVAYVRWCGVRPVLQKYYLLALGVAGLAIAIFVGLMICDPFLAHLSDGIVIPATLVLCMVAMYFYFRNMLKERDARP
ncbi:MARVEL domain-containing protein [Janthinobacterium fluminis]|uniref:MARVEL domain-containing protein n=1 Tax=Janthinobacterium fluminis TaxID=2987524 RepID=A0ABT5K5S1_9BURK|nr:MARVEL domain-containing protein [Janthinobacterium fluminis]MDC8760344.1 MARVEL domain-containing protein [Janthinobacterium fluminis]